MTRWLSNHSPAEELEAGEEEYVTINAVILRDEFLYETEIYIDVRAFEIYDESQLIALCIENFEDSIDQSIANG